jgi:hypothetical protein
LVLPGVHVEGAHADGRRMGPVGREEWATELQVVMYVGEGLRGKRVRELMEIGGMYASGGVGLCGHRIHAVFGIRNSRVGSELRSVVVNQWESPFNVHSDTRHTTPRPPAPRPPHDFCLTPETINTPTQSPEAH